MRKKPLNDDLDVDASACVRFIVTEVPTSSDVEMNDATRPSTPGQSVRQ